MAFYVGRSLNVLRDEINASAPSRSKASDGSIGDAAHSSRASDHNPCSCHSCVCARDITHDPAGGFDSYAFADWLRQRCQTGQETRVKYIISNGRIASGTVNNWNWRAYIGINPHNKHVHISVGHGPERFDDTSSWGWPNEEDEDMPSAAEVAKAVWAEPCVSEVDGETYPVGTFIHSTHALAFAGTATADWNDPMIESEVDGQNYPPYVYLKSIHGMVADIQKRLAALESR